MMTKFKRASALILCVSVLGMILALLPAGAAGYDFPKDAVPVDVTVDGRGVLEGETVLINSVTYVPLRSFAMLMGADSVSWNAKSGTATVKKGSLSIFIKDGALYVGANGRYFFTVEEILNISNRLFVPIRAIASAFNASVTWNATTRTAEVRTSSTNIVSGDRFYNKDDLYWLSRIISAESAGEPLQGQIAVGNVVLNRRASKQYPNTVYGVIFDKRGGTQFTPVSIGTIYKEPAEISVVAAKICLEGYSIDSGILFFMNPRIATSNWISKNRPFAFDIGNHSFYY